MSRWILKAANSLVNLIVILCLSVAGIYAAYALWDNNRIYSAANDVQADMIKLKPAVVEKESGADFSELLKVNSDVCAWVSVDNTAIDYPVLQGDTNLSYINTDVYGNFALAGSIFLDSRNNRDFSDTCSLLYGHHMENSKMFGDLDLFKEESFFFENGTGMLILPDRICKFEIFAAILTGASEDAVFEPTYWNEGNLDELVSYVKKSAMYMREDKLEQLTEKEDVKILLLSTCSTEFTDARMIVLAMMEPDSPKNESGSPDGSQTQKGGVKPDETENK